MASLQTSPERRLSQWGVRYQLAERDEPPGEVGKTKNINFPPGNF